MGKVASSTATVGYTFSNEGTAKRSIPEALLLKKLRGKRRSLGRRLGKKHLINGDGRGGLMRNGMARCPFQSKTVCFD